MSFLRKIFQENDNMVQVKRYIIFSFEKNKMAVIIQPSKSIYLGVPDKIVDLLRQQKIDLSDKELVKKVSLVTESDNNSNELIWRIIYEFKRREK